MAAHPQQPPAPGVYLMRTSVWGLLLGVFLWQGWGALALLIAFPLVLSAKSWREAARRQNLLKAQKESAGQASGLLDRGGLADPGELLGTGKVSARPDTAGLETLSGRSAFLGRSGQNLIFQNNFYHLITYGLPGAFKTTGVVIPNLLSFTGSMVVTDPKGELAAQTADHRREVLGQDVFIVNPFGLHGLPNHGFNPFAFIDPDRLEFSGDLENLARQLVQEPASGKSEHGFFREIARALIKTLFLTLLDQKGPQGTNPLMLRKLLFLDKKSLGEVLALAKRSNAFHGVLAEEATRVLELFPDEKLFGGCWEEARQGLDIYRNGTPLAKSVAASDFELRRLKQKPTTVYIIPPGGQKKAFGQWMGLITMQAFETVGREPGRGPVLFLLDEFANLGRLPNVLGAMAEYRGAGLRVWLIVQSRRQLFEIYGENAGHQLAELCETTQVLSLNDWKHAREIEERAGMEGVRIAAPSVSDADTGPYPDVRMSYGEQTRPVLPASGIMAFSAEQLVMMGRAKPLLLEKCPYWTVPAWKDAAKPSPLEGE